MARKINTWFKAVGTYKKWRWLWLVLIVPVIGVAGYLYVGYRNNAAQAASTPALQTTKARTGELIISVTGSGTLVANDTASLAFSTSGTLTELDAEVGDTANKGDVLAKIDDLSARKAVIAAELQLASAQETADSVGATSESELLAAQASVKSAEEKLAKLLAGATPAELEAAEVALTNAQINYNSVVNGPTAEELAKAEASLAQAKNSLWAAQVQRDAAGGQLQNGGSSAQYKQAQISVANAEIAVQQAQLNLDTLKAPATEAEKKEAMAAVTKAEEALADLKAGASEADLASARASLAQAKATLATLQSQQTGTSSTTSAAKKAQLTLEQAELTLASAKSDLAGTTLTAPFTGTVTEVSGKVGDKVGTSALITMVDISQAKLTLYLDEADLASIKVGYEVEASFDAVPNTTFSGKVTAVDPVLVSMNNSKVVRATAILTTTKSQISQLMLGMSATVDVISGRATNAVLVPIAALHQLDEGQYAVFVQENGELTLRTVTVGLKDDTYAEIRSGLKAGEVVSTGIMETK